MIVFSASLINDPFGDPGMYLEFRHRRAALLFDLGDLHALAPRKILKISHVFVSHTHMDHFIGFDQLLRVCLGRDMRIALCGPPGFLERIERRLGAYTWNLVGNYLHDVTLAVTELRPDGRRTRQYRCREAFRPEFVSEGESCDGTVASGPFFSVRAAFLDHRIPCLAYCFVERQRIHILKNALEEMGLPVGSWLAELKERIAAGAEDGTPIRIPGAGPDGDAGGQTVALGELRSRIVKIAPGQKVAYVTDAVWSEENARTIVGLAQGADHLFIEATFLAEDESRAKEKHHLTARQAGTLARRAGVKRMTLFHFSPKYRGRAGRIAEEAASAFAQ